MNEKNQNETARLAAALIARRDFSETARLLNQAGIIPMPLKGVLMQHAVYERPSQRILSDVDVLLPPGTKTRALGALRDADYRIDVHGKGAIATKGPNAVLETDVHYETFGYRLFRLRAPEIFSRASEDTHIFDARVMLPAPLDLYALLIGNFVKGRSSRIHHPQIRDFAAVARRYALHPSDVARHLEHYGMARAARYTLPFAVDAGDRFAAQVLRHLTEDPMGVIAASLARRLVTQFEKANPKHTIVAPHLVNQSLVHGLQSFGVHLGIGMRMRLERAWRQIRPDPNRNAST